VSLPEHLGGHKNKTHLDEGAINHMMRMLNVKSMLDIGCGPGGMVQLATEKGLHAEGIDGDFEVKRDSSVQDKIHIWDYTKGPSPLGNKTFDLAWSCEFVEHVDEEYVPNFMADFQRANFVIMTYAPPGTSGHHHVNCQPQSYWVDVFKQYGFQYDANMTRQIREVSTMGRVKKDKETGKKKWWKDFIKQTGLCFVKS
jgi:SAM-dependent methyltransferase